MIRSGRSEEGGVSKEGRREGARCLTHKGQAYWFSPSSRSGLVNFCSACSRLLQLLMSRLRSRRGSNVSEVFMHFVHLTVGVVGGWSQDHVMPIMSSAQVPHVTKFSFEGKSIGARGR